MNELLTSPEVSKALKVTEATLADWRYRGIGPQFVKLGRLVRYRPGEIDRWLESGGATRGGR